MERKSFVFYKDWRDVIKDLPDDIRLELYDCIMEYAFTGKVEGLKPMVSIAFNFIKTTMDRNSEKYEGIIEKRRSAGKKGGLTKKKTVANEANAKDAKQTVANEADNVNDNDNVSTNVDEEKESTIVDENEACASSIPLEKSDFEKFNSWLVANTPNVLRLKSQITEAQFKKLKAIYDTDKMTDILCRMDNYKDLTKKYVSVYQTFLNWAKREYGNI